MLPVGDQVREAVEQGFEGLIGGDDMVETHEGTAFCTRASWASKVMMLDTPIRSSSCSETAQSRFSIAAAVLTPAVEQGHNDCDAVRLTAGGLNQPLQVLEMVVGDMLFSRPNILYVQL